jgi:hypothetical protein
MGAVMDRKDSVDYRLGKIIHLINELGFYVTLDGDGEGFASLYLHDRECLDRGDYDYE